MKHLVTSFQNNQGVRGVHVYSYEECHFLTWDKVVAFINSLPESSDPAFGDKLLESVANYNPDREFLAVRQNGDTVSIELYALNSI